MKNICLYVWGLLMLLVSCTPSQPKDYYEIVGEVKNVADSTIINLFRIEGSMGKTIAVDTIIGGKFYFKIKPDSLAKDELNLACFRSREFPTMACKLWASAGDIVKVTGENALIHTWKVKGGAPENASMQAYLDDSRPLWDEYQLNAIRQKNMSTRGRDLSEEEYQMWKQERDSLESVNKELSLRIAANVISRMKKKQGG